MEEENQPAVIISQIPLELIVSGHSSVMFGTKEFIEKEMEKQKEKGKL